MKKILLLLAAVALTTASPAQVDPNAGYHNCIIEGNIPNNGIQDAQPGFQKWFAQLGAMASVNHPITGVIPAGNYYMGCVSAANVPICPNYVTIIAIGANFIAPTTLSQLNGVNTSYPNPIMFGGTDVSNFKWIGGKFIGHVFNPYASGGFATNSWLPIEGVFGFYLTSTAGNGCKDLIFEDVQGLNTGASVIAVFGINSNTNPLTKDWTTTTTPCVGITIQGCKFVNCGQLLWDYGWLWQIISFQDAATGNYPTDLVNMATTYMRPVSGTSGGNFGMVATFSGTNVLFNNSAPLIGPTRVNADSDRVSFYPGLTGTLPSNIVQGQAYYVLSESSTGITISSTYGGGAITFTGSPTTCGMFYNMTNSYYNLYLPYGANQLADGVFNIQDAQNVRIIGNSYSTPGDAEQIIACTNITFTGNQLTSCSMGAWVFSGCDNWNTSGNNFNGQNGSRICSVEERDSNGTLAGNVFLNGGRGSIFVSPTNLVVSGNTFTDNSWKSYAGYSNTAFPTPLVGGNGGRIDYGTGTWYQESPLEIIADEVPTAWSNVSVVGNNILSNSGGLSMFSIGSSGSGFFAQGNACSGTHVSWDKSTTAASISNVQILENNGASGRYTFQANPTMSSAVYTITNPLQNNIQSASSVTWSVSGFTPNNTLTQAAGIPTCTLTNTTLTVTFPNSITGAASFTLTLLGQMQ